MGLCKSKPSDTTLRIRIGPEENVKAKLNFKSQLRPNKIRTTKYTLLTFLPRNLCEQFRRVIYFLSVILIIVSCFDINIISPLAPLVPLLIVLISTAIKDAREDYSRYKSDKTINETKVTIIRNGVEEQINSEFVSPGDLVVIYHETVVPCDLVLLQTSNKHNKCYVTTANLDGEANLKTLYVPSEIPRMPNGSLNLLELGAIVCESPTMDLYSFNGRIELKEERVLPLTAENVLLYGSCIKSTECVIGCAIYTGMTTKLQLNSRYSINKMASSNAYINKYVMTFVVVLLILFIVLYLVERFVEVAILLKIPFIGLPYTINSTQTILNDFMSYVLLFNFIVPVSMYINIECYRRYSSSFIRSDRRLYDDETDQPCLVNTTNLNEDLGQINILFSDKTGTLTKNEMNFIQCSINGIKYLNHENHIQNKNTTECFTLSDFNDNQKRFFQALTICHSVNVNEDPNNPIPNDYSVTKRSKRVYETFSSPDEKALLQTCADIGLIYDGIVDDRFMCIRHVVRDQTGSEGSKFEDIVTKKYYERLHEVKFTSERKRMSVIVRDENKEIWLYSKGADDTIFPLCSKTCSSLIDQTDCHITEFARNGLRTLVVARKQLSYDEYATFVIAYDAANSALENRQQLIADCYSNLENELELLGATAVEDALQDNVAETLVSLEAAGIKIWVLTGDKVETAVAIGLACKHIPANAEIQLLIDIVDKSELVNKLSSVEHLLTTNPNGAHALIINGSTLSTALEHSRDEFARVALLCKAVICCRLSPLQKSDVVELIKSTRKYLTAAIGDGDNDVSMIQSANVGIGITGLEGRQAARCADYAIARFNMLLRLLLVHGHYNSERLAFLVFYCCYKNLMISGVLFLYQFYCLYSATSIFYSVFLWLYDLLFISFSFTFLAFSDKPFSEEVLMTQPELYKLNSRNRQASWTRFGIWMLNAVLHIVTIFYFTYFFMDSNNNILNGGQTADFYCFGTMMITVMVLVCNLKLMLAARYLSTVFLIFVGGSIVVFFVSTVIENVVNSTNIFGVFNILLGSLSIWLYLIITTIACLLTDYTVKVVKEMFCKSLPVEMKSYNRFF